MLKNPLIFSMKYDIIISDFIFLTKVKKSGEKNGGAIQKFK